MAFEIVFRGHMYNAIWRLQNDTGHVSLSVWREPRGGRESESELMSQARLPKPLPVIDTANLNFLWSFETLRLTASRLCKRQSPINLFRAFPHPQDRRAIAPDETIARPILPTLNPSPIYLLQKGLSHPTKTTAVAPRQDTPGGIHIRNNRPAILPDCKPTTQPWPPRLAMRQTWMYT